MQTRSDSLVFAHVQHGRVVNLAVSSGLSVFVCLFL